jgi:hypothetical protein
LSDSIITNLERLEKKSFELIQYEQIDLLELEFLKEEMSRGEYDKHRAIEAIDRLIKNNSGETSLIRELRSDLNSIVLI